MRFSVVIPTLNRLNWLPATLESVHKQACQDFEIIVVDNGSSDGTVQYLRSREPTVRLLELPPSAAGPGMARNAGAHASMGEYIAFLDSDDLWFPWTLEVFAELISRHDAPALLTSAMRLFADASELTEVTQKTLESDAYPDYFSSSDRHYSVGAGTMVVRRDVFAATKGFDPQPMNMEDHDLALRLGCAHGFIAVKKPVTLGWRRHEGSVSMDISRTLRGARHIITQEKSGQYPGGAARARQRRSIITAHVRPVSLHGLQQGHAAEAWDLYRNTLRWHFSLGRWKYLLGFPFRACLAQLPRLEAQTCGSGRESGQGNS